MASERRKFILQSDQSISTNINRHFTSATHMERVSTYQIIVFLLCLSFSVTSSVKTCKGCDQGQCINNTCVCLPGWRGSLCNECYGRISFENSTSGVVHDGSANYSKDSSCSWLLEAPHEGMRLTLTINQFATECVWDHLYVHNGDSAFAPLEATYSGILLGLTRTPDLTFELQDRYAFIHFYSDAAFTLPGFNISYSLDDCALKCSPNGVCNNSMCVCKEGFTGPFCDKPVNMCTDNCTHGVCETGSCVCEEAFNGPSCSLSKANLHITSLPGLTPPGVVKRASASMLVDGSMIYIMGGYRMANMSVGGNMFTYSLPTNTLQPVTEGQDTPWPRYGHSTVIYQDQIYLYGGVYNSVHVSPDLWVYSISNGSWTPLPPGPLSLTGHTAHVYRDAMVVFFGYSSDVGYSSLVMEYDFASGNWSTVPPKGSLVQGSYGHSSVWDSMRGFIYVYGGYHSLGAGKYNLSDQLNQYDPERKEWFRLQPSGSPRYLHTAVMMHGLMVTYGGNVHNNTSQGHRARCFSSDFVAYDRDCNAWFLLKTPEVDGPTEGIDRFGQSMVAVNSTVYMFGGFNSIAKHDLLKIKAGNCSFYSSMETCGHARPGLKCQWDGSQCDTDVTTIGTNTNCPADKKNTDNEACTGFDTCAACREDVCSWCDGQCITHDSVSTLNCTVESNCTADPMKFCGMFHKCQACHELKGCHWDPDNKQCQAKTVATKALSPAQCSTVCSDLNDCTNCTNNNCMWCSSRNQCIDTNSYVVAFHYGQCMEWTTHPDKCRSNTCTSLKTCGACQANPRCGWCNDDSDTGIGRCLPGGMGGPVVVEGGMARSEPAMCPGREASWFFNECPLCQCNGHSTCMPGTDVCLNCSFPTHGSQCEACMDGWYGNPHNNGSCNSCSCNDQADSCDPISGKCFCRTRGVNGHNCTSCDSHNRYHRHGNLCYYELNTDYQYTFNLSKPEDRHYTQINFLNSPATSERDVDFTLNCSTNALLNITYKSTSFPEEQEFVIARSCDYFRTKFEHNKFVFGGKENTTFMVYVYDFKTPFVIQISFVQPDKINLLKFFIIFFSCFLSLVLIAALMWKVKHKYNSYRRRQQLMVEMEQMASRPFSTINLEVDYRHTVQGSNDKVKDHTLDQVLRRRKKSANKPSAIAVEHMRDNKAGILSLVIQLPTGGAPYAPSGCSGLAIGSALVALGHHRKQSVDHTKGDKAKSRKHHHSTLPPDAQA